LLIEVLRFLLIIGVIVVVLVWVMPRLLVTHQNAEKAHERGMATLYEADAKAQ